MNWNSITQGFKSEWIVSILFLIGMLAIAFSLKWLILASFIGVVCFAGFTLLRRKKDV